jgi:hypothetical protein
MFVQAPQCQPAEEQNESRADLAECEGFRRFHRNPAISTPSASAQYQHSANPRDGNSIPPKDGESSFH